ncbi:MAG: hypothetical protein JWQ71_2577 [Pedosphaera sp.]|nr:hypothetical protein [Pedosphaera sp.]
MRIIVLILLSPVLLLGWLLGLRRRDIAYLPEGHPDMAKAIAEARATLPEFRRLLASPEPGMANFGIKARFPVQGGSEHCWVGDLEMRGSGFFGKLTNHPQSLHEMVLGSMVDITEDMITDWAYSKDGVYSGHFTTRVLLPRMSKRMRQQVETIYGWSGDDGYRHNRHSKGESATGRVILPLLNCRPWQG